MSVTRPGQLPVPDPAAQAHSRRLQGLLLNQIEQAGGRLPFDRFMETALYAPGLGYYAAGLRKFGAAGDFVTAPEISPLFGRCLARQCRQLLRQDGGGILEFGAGSGALAVALLAELERLDALPGRYLILELSAELRQRQRQTLSRQLPHLLERVVWLEGLPPAGFCGVVIANEVLDAMPVSRFRLQGTGAQEQVVTVADAGGLALQWRDLPEDAALAREARVLQREQGLADDYQSEINLRAGPWLRALAERLERGLVLLIDYGHDRHAYYHPQRNRGTLMCHYRHRAHDDPLWYPGLQDITAHVDFSRLAREALACGLEVCGYATQAFFLMGCGLERMVAASDPEDVAAHMHLMQAVKQLTLPSEMGERFKVLGLCRGLREPPEGFALQDLRGRL